jgi:hypothetical protein
MAGVEDVRVFLREKGLARKFSSQNFFQCKYPNILKPSLFYTHTYLPMKMEQSVPKRRHINFRRRGITQKKAYNFQNTAKVWNQE